ncbi:hypothetical protein [Parabacteroides gordonii]|uniref:hypothetical protein n=1 Tax=Parabacteroides gordonii TaxID=574930 RepID=UPI0026F33BA9|nr:hypothetical protein [Parabacteroides gordonii]
MKRLLLLLFLTLGISVHISAQGSPKGGDPIDYSRILMPREKGSHPVTYTMYYEIGMVNYPITFAGELIRTREINSSLREKAIRRALDRMSIDRNQIAKWNEQVKQAKEDDYTTEQFLDDIGKISGYDNVTDVLAMLSGIKDPMQWLQNWFDQKTSREALVKELLSKIEPVGKAISEINKIKSFLEKLKVLQDARERDKQKWLNRIASYAAEGLAQFYKEVNKILRQLAKGEDSHWVLRVEGSANAPFSYELTRCVQQWSLKMHLDKNRDPLADYSEKDDNAYFNTFEGDYYGWLEAEAVYDLSNYDANYYTDNPNRLVFVDDNSVRFTGSAWKMMSKTHGTPWNEKHKRSKAISTFELPVRVRLKLSEKPRTFIYGDTKVYMGDEKWLADETPHPRIDTKLDINHRFEVKGSFGGASYMDAYGHDYVSNGVRYQIIRSDFDLTTNPDNIFEVVGSLTWKGAFMQTNSDDSTRVDNTEFANSPNGTLQVNLRQSIADEEEHLW